MLLTADPALPFEPLGMATIDADGRISLASLGPLVGSRFAISVNAVGEVLLTPFSLIPEREHLMWEDDDLRASLDRAMKQAAAGDLHDLGDFSQYLPHDLGE